MLLFNWAMKYLNGPDPSSQLNPIHDPVRICSPLFLGYILNLKQFLALKYKTWFMCCKFCKTEFFSLIWFSFFFVCQPWLFIITIRRQDNIMNQTKWKAFLAWTPSCPTDIVVFHHAITFLNYFIYRVCL